MWFRWIDIADEAALAEDVDVGMFPASVPLLGADLLFFGTTPPKPPVFEHQRSALRDGPAPAPVEAPELLAVAHGPMGRVDRFAPLVQV